MQTFEQDWRTFYPNADPAGWMMRNAGAKHWLRFHSLPLSKRYADTDAERQILLYRQNTLASEVLGAGRPCWLAQTFWPVADNDAEARLHPLRAWPKYQFEFAFRFLTEKDDPEFRKELTTYASRQPWQADAFDDLLWAAANEKAAYTLWMSCSTGAVFAPYDGGVDLFLPTDDHVKALKIKHPDWLPTNAHGL